MRRRVFKARIVPDTAPDSMTEKVIRVADLGVPLAAAFGNFDGLTDGELEVLADQVLNVLDDRRMEL